MKCLDCEAENPDGKRFCGQCGARLEELPVQPATPHADYVSPVATQPRVLFSLSERTKKRLVVGAIAVAVILIISTLGYLYYDRQYYHQPASGSGSVSTTTIDAGQGVQFGFEPSQGTPPFRYSWDFGDGGISAEQNPHHSYSSPGTYQPKVTVSTRAGETTTWTTSILVNQLPSVTGTVSPSVGVLSLNASFTAQGRGGMPSYNYSWQFGDGASSDIQNPTHQYSTGKYLSTVVVRDRAGMTASWSVNISVNLPLTTGIEAVYTGPGWTEAFYCTPSQGVPPYSYYWQFGDGESSTLQNPSHIYGTGTYSISLIVTDSVGETVEAHTAISMG